MDYRALEGEPDPQGGIGDSLRRRFRIPHREIASGSLLEMEFWHRTSERDDDAGIPEQTHRDERELGSIEPMN